MAAFSAVVILASCTKGFDLSVTPLTQPSDSAAFITSFKTELRTAGLTDSDASFISDKASTSLSMISSKPSRFSFKTSADWGSIGETSMKAALDAISSNSHFPTASRKTEALAAVTRAHFNALVPRVSSSDMASIVGRVAEVSASSIDETGLTGADLEAGMKAQSTAFANALMASSIPPDFHSNIVKTFSSGAMLGLNNNPDLASQSKALAVAIAQGALAAVGSSEGVLTDYEKGQIIQEFLQGVADGLSQVPGLSEAAKAEIFSNVANDAQTTLIDVAPTLVDNVSIVVGQVGAGMPGVSISPTPAPTPAPTPTPTPTPNPSDSQGTPVVSSGVNCSIQFGGGGVAKPSFQITSNNQCQSYCDTVANNFSTADMTCRVPGKVLQTYYAPRDALYPNSSDPITCVARITNTNGAVDFKPDTVVDKTSCLNFCDTVIPYGGVKVCYGNASVIREYWGNGL